MKQFSKDLGNVSLAPKGRWSKEQEYERLNLVYNDCDNLSYVAKIDVPIGVEIDNREYWQPMNATGYADNNFINLTAENENGTITAYETLEEAVATILPINRKAGATLSFYNLNADRLDRQAEFELWQFNSTDLANWENKDYWNNIYYNWNVFVGWYIGADTLKNHVKIPNVGQYAYVGTNLNDALLYQCRTNGTWTNTGIKVRNYISVVVSGNITIGKNGNWFSDGEDTGIPATPAVDEQLDNIIMRLQQHATEIDELQKQDVVLKSNIDSNFETINNKVDNIKTATDNKIDTADVNLQNQITSNDNDIATLNTKHESLSRTVQGIAATGGASTANNVTYNNDTSGLNAENAQDAIDEVSSTAIYDVSARNNGAVFESLQAILSSSNLNTLIPTSVRHGGMTIRFIKGSEQNSDNEYVQYRLITDDWSTTPANWQGVDDEPTAGSDNLVKSGGVANQIIKLDQEVFRFTEKEAKTRFKNYKKRIAVSTLEWQSEDTSLCILIPTVNISSIAIKGYRTRSCGIAFLKSDTTTGIADFCEGTSLIKGKSVHEVHYDIPSDCNFIYIGLIEVGNGERFEYFKITSTLSSMDLIRMNANEKIFKDVEESVNAFLKKNIPYNISPFPIEIKYGIPNGIIGGKIEAILAENWKYSIFPVFNSSIVNVSLYSSSLGTNIIWLDNNKNIIDMYEIPYKNEPETFFEVPNNACYIVVPSSEKVEAKVILSSLKKRKYIGTKYQVSSTGEIKASTTMLCYRVNVSGMCHLAVELRSYSGSDVAGVTFFDKDDNFISYLCKMTPSDENNVTKIFAEIPSNASYAFICTRDNYNAKIYTESFIEYNRKVVENESIVIAEAVNSDFESSENGIVSASVRVGDVISFVANGWWYTYECIKNEYDAIAIPQDVGSSVIKYTYTDESNIVTEVIESKRNGEYKVLPLKDTSKLYFSVTAANKYTINERCYFIKFKKSISVKPLANKIQITSNGIIKRYSATHKTYKLDVSNLNYIVAKVRCYSGADVVSLAYYDDNGEFISSSYKNTAQNTNDVTYIFSKIPINSKYAFVSTRNTLDADIYLCNDASIADNSTEQYRQSNEKRFLLYEGEKISLPHQYEIKHIGNDVIEDYIEFDESTHSGQGCAVFGNYLFRLHSEGVVSIYDISDIDNVKLVNRYKLGSYPNTHGNCAQFSMSVNEDTGFPLLYVSGSNGCFVEKVGLDGSTLVQTINLNISTKRFNSNTIIGNNGYLYSFGGGTGTDTELEFYKINLPSVDIENINLTDKDVVDSWRVTGYNYANIQWQGGMVYNGKLYFVFGALDQDKVIWVYDLTTHEKVSVVNLPYFTIEPEDCDIYNGKMLLCSNGVDTAYLLDFK